MKKNYSTKHVIVPIFFLIGAFHLNAQMVYIADTNFRNVLSYPAYGYASCIVGDSIDSSCPQVVNTITLSISSRNLHDLQGIQAFTNLRSLDCHDNFLTSLPTLPVSLGGLNCSQNELVSLPLLPDSLGVLNCYQNQLTSLPALPPLLVNLACDYNQLTSLPALPDSLKDTFSCAYNQLTSLPALPIKIRILVCENNLLTSLPVLPPELIELYCWNNHLISLPTIPFMVHRMICSGNQLTSLPALPDTMWFLNCSSNHLTNLPVLPQRLGYFECENNLLTSLPVLPNQLSTLWCYNNQLTILPVLPNGLDDLRCHYNLLYTLPTLPNLLTNLYCNNNLLSSIPELPDSLYNCALNNNSNVSCLPQLKRIQYLDFTNTSVTCLPNYGSVSGSSPPLSSLPLCGLFNPNGCRSFYNISGKSYFDENANCAFDSVDVRQENMHMMLYKNGNLIQQTFTGGEGYYSYDVLDSVGDYSVQLDTSNIPFTVLCPVSIYYNDTITATDTVFYNNDFALKCKANGFDLGVLSIEGYPFRPANDVAVYIHAGDIANFYGAHCAAGISGTVTISFTSNVNYISPYPGALTPDIISGNTLTYNIPDFGAINLFNAFNVIMHTDTFATNGQEVCFTVDVSLLAGDNNSFNNSLAHCFPIHASYDPNEKEVDPISDVDLSGNRWLTYTIHFQNTGSAEAEDIYIDDTLDSHLELATFQLLAYSHHPLVQIFDGGIARFNFANINLPDSNTNEPASHGYIQFKIKIKDNAPVETQISNTAYIYFDFNTPVITNTTVSTLICSPVSQSLIANICPGSNYNFYGQLLSVGGTYVDTIHDSFGCDSIITLQLSINQTDTSVSLNSDTLTSHASGATYQWLNCSTGTIVSGAVMSTFVPVVSGNYAAIVSQNNCTDTSSCYAVVVTGISNAANESGIEIFPNPSKNEFTVYCSQCTNGKKINLKLSDVLGKELLFETMRSANCRLSTADFPSGIYFLRIETEDGLVVKKLVKE